MADILSAPSMMPPPRRDDLSGRAAAVQTKEQARAVAEKFESMFVAEMLGPMFSGIETDGPFGGGSAEAAFRPMLLEQYAKGLSASNGGKGIGIADAVYKEILKLQGLSE